MESERLSHLSSANPHLPLVVIVGPTASGKTALAIKLAQQFNGEIICADSRTVYKNMDIGTAKPSKEDQAKVPHWGLDIVEPNQRYSAAEFKQYAQDKIIDIRSRGRVPFIVGGTGLYVDGVIFDFHFVDKYDEKLRSKLNILTVKELQEYCYNNNIELPKNLQNKRHLIRAIEQKNLNPKRSNKPMDNTIIVGMATNSQMLQKIISTRIEQMLTYGVVEESIMLGKKYGWNNEAMTGNIYPIIRLLNEGKLSRDEALDKMKTADWRLAKRQMTWFRRNPFVYWGSSEQLYSYVVAVLNRSM